MGFGPVVRGAHKAQKDREVLQSRFAQRALQGTEAAGRIRRLEERMRRAGEDRLLHRGVRVGQLNQRRLAGFALGERRLQTCAARQRTADQGNDFVDALHGASGIAGRSPQSDEEPHVARDAIAHLAEARKVDKQPLLEQRRQHEPR